MHRRRPPLRSTLAFASTLAAASALPAQLSPALGVGSAAVQPAGTRWSSAVTLSPSLRIDRARLALAGGATFRGLESEGWARDAEASGAAFSRRWGRCARRW